MKYLLSLLLLVSVAYAQYIPKNANTIIVKGVTFNDVVNRLLDEGWHIAQIDSVQQTIKTEATPTKRNGVILVTMYVRVKDSIANITGNYNIEGNKETYAVENRGIKGSPLKNSFILLNEIALSFGKPVDYKTL